MVRGDVISDELWQVISSVLPPCRGHQGRPWNDHRRTLEGIAWRFRTGSPWRDLPGEFGSYQSVWQRHRLWSTDGTYAAMLAAGQDQLGADGLDLGSILSIDSTNMRAHQHAAGARRDSVVAPDVQDTGGRSELHEFSDRARGAA